MIILIFFAFNFPVHGDDLEKSLEINAKSAILMDEYSGRILYSLNPYEKTSIASTTKIMTCLIALERGNIKDMVKISENAVRTEGSSIYLKKGEKVSLEDLLYGLMLRSGNDAAVAIAEHIGGTEKNFVDLMNRKSEKLNLTNTHFSNPHGLEDENHFSNAYDLALITREAFKNEEFKKIVSVKTWKANREDNNYFCNKNKTLWDYEDGNGVKIGYTKKAGRCLVASSNRNGMQLIAVVLDDGNWFDDAYKLMSYGFENYYYCNIYDKNKIIDSIDVVDGDRKKINVSTKESLYYPIKKGEEKDIKIYVETDNKIYPPISKGARIGKITVYLDGEVISVNELVSKNTVRKLSFFEKIKMIFTG